jgi:hypothetical protein
MASKRTFSPSPPDGVDSLMTDLREFSSTTGLQTDKSPQRSTFGRPDSPNSPESEDGALDGLMKRFLTKKKNMDEKACATVVEIPPIQNTLQFKWIRGHSTVRRVLEEKRRDGEIGFFVELESSDKEWVRKCSDFYLSIISLVRSF